MTTGRIDFNKAYVRSEDVVARAIEDEYLLVPITAGIGDMEDALYTLNESGREIWTRLAPGKTVNQLVQELQQEFDAAEDVLAADVSGLLAELLDLRMVEVND